MKAVTITYIMSHFKTTLHTWFTLKYIPKNQSVHIQKYRHISHSSQLDFCHKFSFIQRKATVVLFFFFQRGSINYNFKLYVQWLAGFLFYFFFFFFAPPLLQYHENQQWLTCTVLCLNGKCKTVLQKYKCSVSRVCCSGPTGTSKRFGSARQ